MNTEGDWEAALEASREGGVVLFADYTASWCKKCHELKPKVEELAASHKDVLFVLLDVDELEDIAYENGAAAMPMMEVYQNGKRVEQLTGCYPDKLEPMLMKAMGKQRELPAMCASAPDRGWATSCVPCRAHCVASWVGVHGARSFTPPPDVGRVGMKREWTTRGYDTFPLRPGLAPRSLVRRRPRRPRAPRRARRAAPCAAERY